MKNHAWSNTGESHVALNASLNTRLEGAFTLEACVYNEDPGRGKWFCWAAERASAAPAHSSAQRRSARAAPCCVCFAAAAFGIFVELSFFSSRFFGGAARRGGSGSVHTADSD